MTEDQAKYKRALNLGKDGKYKDALTVARNIDHPGARAGLLVDCGFGIGKPSIIRQGIDLFQELLRKGNSGISKASLLYNIGNGYYAIYQLRRRKGGKIVPPNDDDLRKAKRFYRESLSEIKGNSPSARSQTQVNYGNCLSAMGRSFEAIDAFNEALKAEPQNGMAAGNLGAELNRIADITGKYRHYYFRAAFDMLSNALGSEMHLSYGGLEARLGIKRTRDHIKAIIDAHKDGIEHLQKVDLSAKNEVEQAYVRFCLNNRLFLNAWAGDSSVSPATKDEISFGPITTSVGDAETVPTLLQIINEIKEAFSTARYLFYLSQSNSDVLGNLSKLTSYFDFEVETQHDLFIGFCKSAYMLSFDILDKVARIVNIYFKIGKDRDSFWDVFAEKQSRGESHAIRFVTRPAIILKDNYSLYALSDLCIDYFESEHLDLKTIDTCRNLLTHDYLAVVINKDDTQYIENSITKEELYRQTLSVLYLAKYAILYTVSAIYLSENANQWREKSLNIKYETKWGNK
jgi:tetratricopeptide (TPR) repeat protein